MDDRVERLAKVFSDTLTDRQKDNLLWHARRGTRILCGDEAYTYVDGFGGG